VIWVIGGTSESVTLAAALTQTEIAWVVTATTSSARQLYQQWPGQVVIGSLTPETIQAFLQRYGIDGILDASHPFAVEISGLAMQAAAEAGIGYLRFERPQISYLPSTRVVPHVHTVLADRELLHRRILLTVGVKLLPLFQPWFDRATLWARILPDSVAAALAAGCSPEQLIPMRLPISVEQEEHLWRALRIDTVIAKASGSAGGLEVKQAVAEKLGVRLIVIAKPELQYPQQTSDLETALAFCAQIQSRSGWKSSPTSAVQR
jgi:precorrin-6A/cobalt-precorrin-6A reductase